MASLSDGNIFRPSAASPHQRLLNNFPGRYPVENWRAYYWAMDAQGNIEENRVTLQLPMGYSHRWPAVEIGQRGCIYRVARWGVACYVSTLEELKFDPTPLLASGPEAAPQGDVLQAMLAVTHFDLPGYFVIASQEHPLLLFGPDGDLKGSGVGWYTYLGALAWLRSEGRVKAPFLRLYRENPRLYAQALIYLVGKAPL